MNKIKKYMSVIVLLICLIILCTGCGFNYVHNIDSLTTYKNVNISFDEDCLIVSNDLINKINLGFISNNERNSLDIDKIYTVYVDGNDYYFKVESK